jgi:hypothetical protein
MKKLTLLGIVLFIAAGQSFAQTNDSYKTTLKKLIQVSGTEGSFKAAIQQMFGMFRQQKSEVPATFWDACEAEFTGTSLDELIGMLTPVYQKHMTETDIKNIIAFYETPAGKKYAESTPAITQESMEVGQQWGMKVGQRVMEKLKANGY